MPRLCTFAIPVTLLLLLMCTPRAEAVRPSEELLPATTKGLVSVPDLDVLQERFDLTQLGAMVSDPLMEPFVEDARQQILNRMNRMRVRLGLSMEDLEEIAGGEVAWAAIQPQGDPQKHASALVVDVTGHRDAANEKVATASRNLLNQGARKSTVRLGNVQLVVFTLPKRDGEKSAPQVCYVMHNDQLLAIDHEQVARDMVRRLSGDHKDALAGLAAFSKSFARARRDLGDMEYHVRWFLEPFGYVEVSRASSGGRRKRGTDLLKVLRSQGFTAIQGAGGVLILATGEHEVLHRTMIYAPALERTAGESGSDKYDLAARMLEFPNRDPLLSPAWMPNGVANYLSFNWKMREAFEYSKTLVNELAGANEDEDIFEDVLRGIAKDRQGPQVDIRKDLVGHFAERALVASDYLLPITPQSERMLFVVELTNPQQVARTLEKAMVADPDAKRRQIAGYVVWEVTNAPPAEVEEIKIDSPFGPRITVEPEEDARENAEPLMESMALTVAQGHLLVASHVDFLAKVLQPAPDKGFLVGANDYERVNTALDKLRAGKNSFRFFTRTDEAYRSTYELLRQGKMPESKTMLGKLLNRGLGSDEKGIAREQQIDGTKMPPFDSIRKYLGPAGLFATSEDDGWFVIGCLLHSQKPN